MNQSPLGWPVAFSTQSETDGAGAVSEMDMGGSCKISVRVFPSTLNESLKKFTGADWSIDRCYGTGTP